MCKECGCGTSGAGEHEHAEGGHEHSHSHAHEHGPGMHHGDEHAHKHSHSHSHAHPHSHRHADETFHTQVHNHDASGGAESEANFPAKRRTIEVRRSLLDKNDRLAERNRGYFRATGLLVLNVLSSPGSGKTTLLGETVRALNHRLKAAVIVGDLATDNDARKLRESGAPVVQITTGTMCHLEAEMIGRAAKGLNLKDCNLLIIENVGNLVCPASYDLGEDLRVVLISVTEGEDKPLKYPPIFQSADIVIVSKVDLAAACGLNGEELLGNIRRVAPGAEVLEVSAKTGTGMVGWCDMLVRKHQELQERHPLS